MITLKEDQSTDFIKVERVKEDDDAKVINDWIQLFMDLPSGIHRVAPDAQRSSFGSIGLAVGGFIMQSFTSSG